MNSDLLPLLLQGTGETLYMILLATIASLVIGLPLGVILVVTEKGHIMESSQLNKVLGTIINIVRSFPQIILIVVLLPLARLIVGTSLGSTAAIVPLAVGSAPFLARVIESSLKEVENGKVEAAQAVGARPFEVIGKVLIPEALPSLIRGITLAIIAITGFTAIAGAIGAGGLGSLAIRFGYMRYRDDVMYSTVIILVVMIQGVQLGGELLAKRIDKRRHKLG
ncbi:MAG: methionine ABC transporter permease [Thermacetogeniaceae bacterium]